jgi:Tfp pilus assembly protein PilV
MIFKLYSRTARGGFSLVEVCLAVLVVGLGIMAVFSLFPTGLAAGEAAATDTSNALLAQQLASGLGSQASTMSLDEWKNNQFGAGITIGSTVVTPANQEYMEDMAYLSTITNRGNWVKTVTIYVMPWKGSAGNASARITTKGEVFYTELYRMEPPQ